LSQHNNYNHQRSFNSGQKKLWAQTTKTSHERTMRSTSLRS